MVVMVRVVDSVIPCGGADWAHVAMAKFVAMQVPTLSPTSASSLAARGIRIKASVSLE